MTERGLLVLEDIEKRFGTVVAVAGVSFAVAEGEFLSLLGPSGCGKTTILRCVAGFERPDRGHVRLAGERVNDLPPERRDIGMVFQSYALFPNMTVAGNIGFPMMLRGVPPRERARRIEELLTVVRLPGYGGRRISELSGGQRQRVALARALAKEPRLLLLDEPLSALDAKIREELRIEIRRIQKELGITAVYVTHDQEEALAISDRVAVMNAGRIEQLATPVEIYRRPRSLFVAGFVGTMNFLEGRIVDGAVVHRGIRLRHRDAGRWPEGAAVVLALRPEELRLGEAQGENTAGHNRLDAISGPSLFLGATARLRLTVEDGSTLEIDLPAAQAGTLAMGTPVVVTFAPDAGVLLPVENQQVADPSEYSGKGGGKRQAMTLETPAGETVSGKPRDDVQR